MGKPWNIESSAFISRLSAPSRPNVAMANSHLASECEPSHSPVASRSGKGSHQSTRETVTASQVNMRNSAEVEMLLQSSNESVHYLPTPSDEEGSTTPSEEADKDIQFLSRMTSFSKSYTIEEDKAIARIFDRRLVLFMALLYMMSFLDRSNIGNARIAGLESSLSLQPGQYAWLLTAFYITYIVFEWMTLLYHVIPPHIYISLCVLSWGLIASVQSVVSSFRSLLVLRALLGVAEAAFGPGVPFYLSFFYKRSELAYRVGLFISAAPLATSCASSLAWLIVKLSQHGPLEPWRALFLVEGFPSIILAAFAWHIVPDAPSTARYLTPRERKVANLRLRSEDGSSKPSRMPVSATGPGRPHSLSLSVTDLLHTLLDPQPYLTSLMFFSANVSFSSLPVFLPSILEQSPSTSTALASQLLSAPPYLVAFPFVLLTSHLSDRRAHSRAHTIVAVSLLSSVSYTAIALAGYFHASLGPTTTWLIRYASVFGAAMGFFAAITLIITWTLNNQRTATGKGTGVALLNVVGQCGPLVGTRLYPETDAPYYVRGMAVCAAFMMLVAVLAVGLRWWLCRLNGRGKVKGREANANGEDGEEKEEDGSVLEMVELGQSDDTQADRAGREWLMGKGRWRKSHVDRDDGDGRFEYML